MICPLPEVLKENDNIEQTVTEEMLDEVAEICLTETDTISLLDIPSSIFVTEDADDAGVIKWVKPPACWFTLR